jgi:L-methionine (R)-S-oxide reductase
MHSRSKAPPKSIWRYNPPEAFVSCQVSGARPKSMLRRIEAARYEVGPNRNASEMRSSTVETSMTPTQTQILQEFAAYARTAATADALMKLIVDRLHERMTRYNWVGFYLVDSANSGFLNVGPFAGSFTPNARIPVDTGLCGAAATTGKVVVVQDVTKDPRYLPGSSLVKSEMVVPIFVNQKFAAELDAESYFTDTFNRDEQKFVEACADVVAGFLGK